MNLRVPALAVFACGAQAAFAHHSFAPHFDASKRASIAGTDIAIEPFNCIPELD